MRSADSSQTEKEGLEQTARVALDLAELILGGLIPTLEARLVPAIVAGLRRHQREKMNDADILTALDVEREYGIPRKTIYNKRSSISATPFVKCCGRLRVRRDRLEAWLDEAGDTSRSARAPLKATRTSP